MHKPKAIRVKPGERIHLGKIDAGDTHGIAKEDAAEMLEKNCLRLAELQGRLYAENTRSLLIVLQGMDTSGKDGTIKSVMTAVSPIACQVYPFGPPSEEERDHDFLWRIYQRLPRKGNLGVFNRSHYEDVLVVRVKKLAPEKEWKARFDAINEFESLISSLGTRVLKFFLHIDREEQGKRLEERLADPTKNWKLQPSDLEDRKLWSQYWDAYQDVFAKCSTKVAPWHVVPANKKWYRNLVVSRTIVEELEAMDPEIPKLTLDPSKFKIPK